MRIVIACGCVVAVAGCRVALDDKDSGIYLPNPGMTLKIAVGNERGDSNMALARQVDQITLVDCDGVSHDFPFGGELSTENESNFYLESEALTCVDELHVAGSDFDGRAALVVGVEREGKLARMQCPAAECFPMVFTGRLELPNPDTENEAPHEMRWNVLAHPSLIEPDEETREYVAGACGDDVLCQRMEQAVTSDALLEERAAGSEEWNISMEAE